MEDVERSLGSQLKPFVRSNFLQITSTASRHLQSINKLSETTPKTFHQLTIANNLREGSGEEQGAETISICDKHTKTPSTITLLNSGSELVKWP